MNKVKFYAPHALVLDGTEWAAGEHEETVTKSLLKLLNHAHAAGAVELEGADPGSYGVQSQEDGEAAYAKAQEDGTWHEGNALAAEEMAQATAEMPVDVGPGEGE